MQFHCRLAIYAPKRVRISGNAMMEYVFIGLSTLLVAIGLQVVGGNLDSILSMLKGDMSNKIQITSKVKAKQVQELAKVKQLQSDTAKHAANLGDHSSVAAVEAYNPVQAVGANGIDLVDYYANNIHSIAKKAHASENLDITFARMLDDLAAEGHYVANDERAVLTIFSQYGDSFDFSIQGRYASTLKRATDYLNSKPNLLSEEDAKTLRTASDNISQQMIDFLGGTNPNAISSDTINKKFTDAGGNKGATYVDGEANAICNSGGKNCSKS